MPKKKLQRKSIPKQLAFGFLEQYRKTPAEMAKIRQERRERRGWPGYHRYYKFPDHIMTDEECMAHFGRLLPPYDPRKIWQFRDKRYIMSRAEVAELERNYRGTCHVHISLGQKIQDARDTAKTKKDGSSKGTIRESDN